MAPVVVSERQRKMTDDEYKNAVVMMLQGFSEVVDHLKAMQARVYALEKKVIMLEKKKQLPV